MARIILMSGKGGVGKTTVAAATALAAAQHGYRTLVISFDLAHSLSDVFDLPRTLFDQHKGMPCPVADHLDMQEVDVQEEVERHWGNVYKYFAAVFTSTGLPPLVAEELAIVPGVEDVVTLMYLNKYLQEKTYDVLLVDCPPTGESLRFVSMPTTLEWYMHKLFGLERNVMKVARPMVKRLTAIPLPDDSYFAALERLFARLEGIEKVLVDPATTSVRLVTQAEKMVVRETQRAYMYFSLYGMITDQVIINRLVPAGQGSLAGWAHTQAGHVATLREYFQPVPVATLPWFDAEMIGLPRLQDIAQVLFDGADPTQFYLHEPPYTFTKAGEVYTLQLTLPFVQKEELAISRQHDEVVIRVGTFKRHVPLPRVLTRLKTAGAKLEGGRLTIQFVEERTS
jgi:arsenite/tail-anchored protein-transporting ATPase